MASSELSEIRVDLIDNNFEVNASSSQSDNWSLGCDITIEDVDATIQEIKVADVVLSGSVTQQEISVNVDESKVNIMNLDVNMVVNGVSSSLVESQTVPYDKILKITDVSPEATNEREYVSSAFATKKVLNKLEKLELKVDNIIESGEGESGDYLWKEDEDGNLVAFSSVIIKGSLSVEGNITSQLIDDIATWKDSLSKKFYIDNDGNVRCDGNLIVSGDTSSNGSSGENTGGGLDPEELEEYLKDYYKIVDANAKFQTKISESNKIPYSYLSGTPSIPNVPAWALNDKLSASDVPDLSSLYLSLSTGGTINGSVTIKGNLIVEGDTASGGEGQENPSVGGIDSEELMEYLKDYYTKKEIDNKEYATQSFVTTEIGKLPEWAKKSSLDIADIPDLSSVYLPLEGTAKKATQLEKSVTLWGQLFNGTKNISGALSGVSSLTGSTISGNKILFSANSNDAYTLSLETDSLSPSEPSDEFYFGSEERRWLVLFAKYGNFSEDVEVSGSIDAQDATLLNGLTISSGGASIKGDVTIDGNLIVKGDTSSGGTGQDTPSGGVTEEDVEQYLTNYVNTITTTGSGNVISSVSKSGKIITFTKGVTALTSHQSLQDLLGSSSIGSTSAYPYWTGSAWATKTLGARAFDDTAYLPISGGTISGNFKVNGTTTLQTVKIWNGGNTVAEIKIDKSSLAINKELKLTNGGEADIATNIAAAFKTDIAQIKTLIANDVYIGASSGTTSNLAFNIKTYQGVNSEKPSYKATVFSVDTSGNITNSTWHGTTVGVAYGGTGRTTLTSGYALIGNGDSAVSLRGITNNTSTTAVQPSDNLITAYTLYYHKGNSYITNVGKITSGTWNGTPIANEYLANNKITIAGTSVSLGGSIAASTITAAQIGSGKTFVHSGNIASQSVDSAKKWSPTNITASNADTLAHVIGFMKEANGATNIPVSAGNIMQFGSDSLGKVQLFAGYKGDSSRSGSHGLYYRKYYPDYGWDTWKEFITSGNIANQNVATAKKLATSVNIWGKSFDGSSDITGHLYLNNEAAINCKTTDGTNRKVLLINAANHLFVGPEMNGVGDTYITGNSMYFRYGAGRTVAMKINSSGNLGLGTSNPEYKLHVVGDSYINGNAIITGDTSSGSDIRFKDIIEHHTLKIEDIANAPCFSFKWNDRDDDSIHLGTSAQYWENVCSELVSGSDFKTLNYASLGVAMGIALAKKNINHEERIKILEDEIKVLNQELRRIKDGICN